MHLKVKSGFFLTLSTIVLSACGGLSSSLPPSSSTPPPSSPSSEAKVCPPRLNAAPSVPLATQSPRARSADQEVLNGVVDVTLTFDAKGGSAVAPVTKPNNQTFAAPSAPTRADFTFEGWFFGKAGLTWLEPEAVEFPLTIASNTTVFAYWEPINSKSITYGPGERYVSTISTSTGARLNPMTYLYSHEDALMEDMSTTLYSTEVDWDSAISKDIADFVGDFSKIKTEANPNGIPINALDFRNIKIGAKSFPKDITGEDFTDANGNYDREIAAKTGKTEWVFEMREDIFFENRTQVNASVVEYSLKQYLDPIQNNRRSTNYYKRPNTQDGGIPILNAEAYRFQTTAAPVAWSTVGFEIISEFTFKIKLREAITQAAAVGFGNIRLVEPSVFAASLTDGANSTYGTPANPFISYGPYLIKSWDDNQRLVLNKNFNYIRRDLVTYKSVAYEYTATPAENVQLFESGVLSATGLVGADFTRYAENAGIKFSWSGFPQYMIVNFAPSRNTGASAYVKSSITVDPRFRQALFFAVDRETYTSTIYVPNVSSVLPVPTNIKAYLEDSSFYSESPQHLENLASFGIPDGTNGYLPTRAKQLFEAALADYKLANPGFTGPINLRLIILDSPFNQTLATFMKSQLETTFNTSGQTDKLIVNIVATPVAANNANTANWDFDLALTNLGFGGSTGVQWQYGSIAFIARLLFGTSFGLHLPFTTGFSASRSFTLTNNSVVEPFSMNAGSALLTGGDTQCLLVGDSVFGTNVPTGAKVKTIVNATTVELTSVIPSSVTDTPLVQSLTFGEGSRITGSTAGLEVGMNIFGNGIRPGTTISSIINANTLVLSTPVTTSGASTLDIRGVSDLRDNPTSFFSVPLNIDLSVTLEYLEGLGEEFIYATEDGEDLLPGHIELYEALLPNFETGKAGGIYAGNLFELAFLMYALDTPYDGTRSEPFPGATEEVWNIVQAMERVFFQQMPMIPTSTLQSAVIYQPNVVFLWPAYSDTFGWGATRYRYLNTDPDFVDGMYNSYQAAFLASVS
jgi:oligopeptide transport system substrate-binding protein